MDSMVQLLSSKRVIQVTDKFWPGNGGIGASWFGVILKPRTSAFFPSHSSITAHWEKLLQSVSDFIFSKYYGCTPRGVKRSEIL